MQAWAEKEKELNAQLNHARDHLRLIAERYALATAAASVGVWDWDLRTNAFYLDPAIKGFLGYRDDEIPDDIEAWSEHIHPEDKDAVMKEAQSVIDGRSTEYVFEHRMMHKDGSVRWFLVRGKVIRDQLGRAVRFVGTDTDITARRELERQVRELSNEVQTQIAHDLHDSLGQELTALLLKLRNAEMALADRRSAAAARIGEARALTEHAIALTETLSRGLSPVLGAGGLARGLGHLAEHVRYLFDIECKVMLPDALPERLSSVCGNELYRIAQEAITNAVRHGGAKRVDVEGRIFNRRFLLNIADDGVGVDLARTDSGAMGIRIMQYRARHLGGSLTISRRRDGGTLVVCSCPIPK